MGRPGCAKGNVRKEFQLHRCLLHHYDVIDFTVFEFGMRVTYFVWRLACLLLFPMLPVTLGSDLIEGERGATPLAGLSYMHVWLVFLITASLLVDVIALILAFISYPTCDLVTLKTVPCYFKLVWVFYNVVSANVLACGFMYGVLGMKDVLGFHFYLVLLMTFHTAVHCSVTAIPSRMAHLLQPLALTLVYILFTGVYQFAGGTDPQGHRYVYRNMDWSFKVSAVIMALLWLLATSVFHILLVLGSCARRLLYRGLRKGKEAIINPDPDDDSSLCSDYHDQQRLEDQPSPRIWIEDIPGDELGHKRVVIESPAPSPSSLWEHHHPAPGQTVYHEVYRDPGGYIHPGDRRKRLLIDTADPNRGQRYYFAPAYPDGSPSRSRAVRGQHTAYSRPVQECGYICHPDISPDHKSTVYKCMPESPTQPTECFACDDDRHLDRIEHSNRMYKTSLAEDFPSNPRPRAHAFVVGRGPIQTFVCPRGSHGCHRIPDKNEQLIREQMEPQLAKAPPPSLRQSREVSATDDPAQAQQQPATPPPATPSSDRPVSADKGSQRGSSQKGPETDQGGDSQSKQSNKSAGDTDRKSAQ